MAKTTVEDCINRTPNHFELVLGVITRAKELNNGAASELPPDRDRNVVISLREIAAGKYTVDLDADIRKSLAEAEELTAGHSTSPAVAETPGPDIDS